MRHFKNFVLAALTFGFFLGLGFSRGLLLQEESIRINLDLPALKIAVDDESYFSSTIVLELERLFSRKVEITKIADSADLSPLLSSQSPPHLILSSLVNLISFSNSEFADISNQTLAELHPDFSIASLSGTRRDVITAFWGYAVFVNETDTLIKTLVDKKLRLRLNLDPHSVCNWKIKLFEELKLSRQNLELLLTSEANAAETLVAHTNSLNSKIPLSGTILWKKAFAIPRNSPDLHLSQKTLEILLTKSFYLAWLNKLPAAGTLKYVDNSDIQTNKKPTWLRQIDLSKVQKDKICPPDWREN